jgi:hypothetical protein
VEGSQDLVFIDGVENRRELDDFLLFSTDDVSASCFKIQYEEESQGGT